MIAAISHLSRLARAGFVFAREGVFALADPAPLPWPAQTAVKLARLIERPTSTSARGRLRHPLATRRPPQRARPARRRANQARTDLRQARSIPGDAARRRRRGPGARSGIAAGQDGA